MILVSNLCLYDMANFLNKYTRFMTKDIYISNNLYHNFLEQYNYLYQKLIKERFLYEDNKDYHKIINIYKNKDDLRKLHNQKYLRKAVRLNHDYFNDMDNYFNLSAKERLMVLAEEDSTYVVAPRNKLNLVVAKINYLLDHNDYKNNSIFVLVNERWEREYISSYINDLGKVNLSTLKEYGREIMTDKRLLDDNLKYDILINYIIYDLFKRKTEFNSFYKAFSKYIYLNKDYQDYDTFKDYHNYMYKRKYLASGKSLKNFNEKEISTRKKYLRTIQNEILSNKEEVDIANLLTMNSILYTYDYDLALFKVSNNDTIYIKYLNKEESDIKTTTANTIYLYKSYKEKKNYLEVLVYELIKRRFPLELLSEEVLYNKLKLASIDSYFSEFIYKYLIPLINYYENTFSLDNVKLSSDAKDMFLKLYSKYQELTNKSDLLGKKDFMGKMSDDIKSKNYKYLILFNDINLDCDIPTMTLADNYDKSYLINENIKLLYDYKKYLNKNQSIPIADMYLNKGELDRLTECFVKENLEFINDSLKNNTKKIEVYEYSDKFRLHVYRNISNASYEIINSNNNKDTIIGLMELKDINILVSEDNFVKIDKGTLGYNNKKNISFVEILKMNKIYDTILLPFLIKDSYHEPLFVDAYLYNIKVMLYIALSKCRSKVIILCPTSKKKKLLNLLSKINK